MERIPNELNSLPAYNPRVHGGLERSEIGSSNDGLQVLAPNLTESGFKPSKYLHVLRLPPDGGKRAELDASQSAYTPKKYIIISAKTLWIVVAAVLFGLTAITVGVGVGVSRNTTSSALSTIPPGTNSTNGSATFPQAISTITATATTTTTSPSSTSSASVENGGCSNGTTFTATDPDKTMFREYCDTDLQVGKTLFTTAIDLGSNKTHINDFEECMQDCAFYRSQQNGSSVHGTCQSVTWVLDSSTCYLKNATILMDRSNNTAAGMLTVPRTATGLHSAEVISG